LNEKLNILNSMLHDEQLSNKKLEIETLDFKVTNKLLKLELD